MSPRRGITTGVGDQGQTRLFSGETVPKCGPRLEALGDLDELNAILGLARSQPIRAEIREDILGIQQQLFTAAGEVATTPGALDQLPARITLETAAALDQKCRAIESAIRLPTDFVVPGATPAGAFLDLARAVARRAERRLVALHAAGELRNECLLVWMNRLSDWLWLLARYEEGESTPLRD